MIRWTFISGGQTGVDRAALDVARDLNLPYGGFVPQGRWTEEGPLSPDYEGMVETQGANPSGRTKSNIRAADATLIISRGPCEGGTLFTLNKARSYGKPVLHVDLAEWKSEAATAYIRSWLAGMTPGTLNVAGPRASKSPNIYAEAKSVLLAVFGPPDS